MMSWNGNVFRVTGHSHNGQWRRALMFSLLWVCINGWVNNREAGDLRRYRADYDIIVMTTAATARTFGIARQSTTTAFRI